RRGRPCHRAPERHGGQVEGLPRGHRAQRGRRDRPGTRRRTSQCAPCRARRVLGGGMTPIRSVVAALFVLLTAALGGCAADTAVVSPTADVQSVQEGVSGLPTVDVDRLPREAQETYILILDG